MKTIPFVLFPYSFNFGDNEEKLPIPGIIVNNPPLTPLLQGNPISFVNFPAPLYIPQVTIKGTTDFIVFGLKILSPVQTFMPLFAKQPPNLDNDFTSTKIEQS
jgi:hypothetical protein